MRRCGRCPRRRRRTGYAPLARASASAGCRRMARAAQGQAPPSVRRARTGRWHGTSPRAQLSRCVARGLRRRGQGRQRGGHTLRAHDPMGRPGRDVGKVPPRRGHRHHGFDHRRTARAQLVRSPAAGRSRRRRHAGKLDGVVAASRRRVRALQQRAETVVSKARERRLGRRKRRARRSDRARAAGRRHRARCTRRDDPGARARLRLRSLITEGIVQAQNYDAIVVGSGISGGWAAKEMTEKGLRVLLLERGKNIEHVKDYVNATKAPWDYPHRGGRTQAMEHDYPVLKRDYPLNEKNLDWWASDKDSPYTEVKRFDWYRGYHVGGRSLLWGRQSYRWSDFDFEANSREGVAVDWPIRYADIAQWYDYVERHAGISC